MMRKIGRVLAAAARTTLRATGEALEAAGRCYWAIPPAGALMHAPAECPPPGHPERLIPNSRPGPDELEIWAELDR
jgi:hypothetical protein